MLPADIRVEPWVWIPFSGRSGRVLLTIMIAIAAASGGYILGRHSDKADVAAPQKTVAASPKIQPVAVNSAAKTRDTGEKPDLALKSDGETKKHIPALTQTKPEAPRAVLLNPGTADPKNVQARAPTRVGKGAPGRVGGEENLPADMGNNRARDEPAAGSRNSMRDYRDLRDYMMRR
jgi:hypothetical protein